MTKPRARELGIRIGRMAPGPLNAITDVTGVRVGHRTLVSGADGDPHAIRTGVTAVFPHDGDPWREPVYAGTHILNGYGELIGINQITEWGVLMSPIVLTSSLAIGKAYDATVRWLSGRDMAAGEEVMPVVSECDDSGLNDVLSFPLTDEDVAAALDGAVEGDVAEGCIGAGTGMQCFDFKGGIGTASRVLPADAGSYTVGVAGPDELRRPSGAADRRRAGGRADHRPDARPAHRGLVRRDRRHRRAAPAASAPSHRATGRDGARPHGFDGLERFR